jgi:SPP1 gp7 family putative phage head morphogenesis protein
MALSDDILDATVRHSIYLERHKASVIRQIVGMVADVNDEVIAQIIKAKIESLTRRQLDQLLTNMRRTIKEGYSPVVEVLDEEVRQLGAQEARFQKRMLESTIPVRLTFDVPSDEQIYAAATARPFEGRLLKEWYAGLSDGAFRRVRDTVRMGYVDGKTTDEIVREIRGTRNQPGVIQQSKRGAEAAVRTALAHTANVAKGEVYKKNRSKIKGVEWVSTLDGRTSAICRGFDGKVFPVDEGPRPPAHVACRSTTIPVIKTARELGLNLTGQTRASMNGQVSAELNYDKWLRRQPREFQLDVLGPTKTKLFLAGLPMDRFIDRDGAELTLKQIEEREAEIWAKAFGAKTEPEPEPEPQQRSAVDLVDISALVVAKRGKSAPNFTPSELNERFKSQLTETTAQVVNKLPPPETVQAITGRGAHYNPVGKKIVTHNERSTVTHEYGHHVDHMLGRQEGVGYWWSIQGLGKEWDADRKAMGVYKVAAAKRNARVKELYDELFTTEITVHKSPLGREYTTRRAIPRFDGADGLSDIIDSFTNGMMYDGMNAYGHGASYWRKFKGTGGPIESFANLFAIQGNPQARAWAEKNIPNLWAKFVQKMEQVANG